MIELKRVSKSFHSGSSELRILDSLSAEIGQGEFAAVMGPSGSGKSTFLGIAAGLDSPDSGEVIIGGTLITGKSESELSRFRSENIGFLFQNFLLIRNMTVIENVSMPLAVSGRYSRKEIAERAENALRKVSMQDRMTHFPSQLSGGEEQRVALARAFVNSPKVLFADEPTGNLDSKNAANVMEILHSLNRENGSTLVIVTHDERVASMADRILEMDLGQLSERRKSRASKNKK
ncbi:MAG TPA: ABC transporter ATP-binding protein [Leptospiraceae bacterium]|nr:ABC transporter ATP-binding protein [Leptospiraceae bacterium]HMY67246.1 ABC transporter ATP-binding protein [Leptospiraceae bacterium]HNF27174.1 ABC transporter ATP-binding protein [Leptospiraceae bacterium]HNN07043.1 ABC transporter ATP-binding protein [Leptospiraceae bacterium]HNO24230.1 ABC transporter ATP-binding protein [Leptospiraceae bacterium]